MIRLPWAEEIRQLSSWARSRRDLARGPRASGPRGLALRVASSRRGERGWGVVFGNQSAGLRDLIVENGVFDGWPSC